MIIGEVNVEITLLVQRDELNEVLKWAENNNAHLTVKGSGGSFARNVSSDTTEVGPAAPGHHYEATFNLSSRLGAVRESLRMLEQIVQ